MAQTWVDLLFMHWPIKVEALRPLVPPVLEIDTYEGQAWLGVVPFLMTDVHLRNMPGIPFASQFPELNVRTYVKKAGKGGVWFFSLDAKSLLAVEVARAWFCLPYFLADMSYRPRSQEVQYASRRTDKRGRQGQLEVSYHPAAPSCLAGTGSIEEFLTERYCLYALSRTEQLMEGEIQHRPWQLQQAEMQLSLNTMVSALALELPSSKPLLHFSKRQETIVWPLHPVSCS